MKERIKNNFINAVERGKTGEEIEVMIIREQNDMMEINPILKTDKIIQTIYNHNACEQRKLNS